jgi:hypothetical protein
MRQGQLCGCLREQFKHSICINCEWNPFSGVAAPKGQYFAGKLAFICLGPVLKYYSPILSRDVSMNLSKDEKKKGGRSSFCKVQDKKAANERSAGIGRGISQQNQMQFG